MTVPGPYLKGAAFREFVMWFEARGGHERLAAWVQHLDPELRSEVRLEEPGLGLIASRWYPSALSHAVLEEITREMTAEQRASFVHDACTAVVNTMIRGVYKLLFEMVATPALYARHIGRLWRQIHTTGDREIKIHHPGLAESLIRNWPGHHPLLCEVTTETMASVFRAMGCHDVRIERAGCVAQGKPECRAMLRWV